MICRRDGIGQGGGGDEEGGKWGEGFLGESPKLFRLGWVGRKNDTCPSSFLSLLGRGGVGGSKKHKSQVMGESG